MRPGSLRDVFLNWKIYLIYYSFIIPIAAVSLFWALSQPVLISSSAANSGNGIFEYKVQWKNTTIIYDTSTTEGSCVVTIPSHSVQWISFLPSSLNASDLALAKGAALDPLCKKELGAI